MKKIIARILAIICCLSWMGFIFYNSTKSGKESNESSYSLINIVREEYKKTEPVPVKPSKNSSKNTGKKSVLPATTRDENINLFFRKNAHAFEYLVLAILTANVFFAFNRKGRGIIIYVMFICLFYAVTDEFHQFYVPGRTSLVSDVLIDFGGCSIGIGLYYAAYYLFYLKGRKVKEA